MTRELNPPEKYIDIKGLYSFHYSEFNKDYYFPGEQHDFWEMIYVDSGTMLTVIDSKELTVRQGEVIFFKPMAFHKIKADRKNALSILVSAFEVSSEAMDFFADKVFAPDKQQRKLLSQFLAEGRIGFHGGRNPSVSTAAASAEDTKSAPPAQEVGAYQLAVTYLELLLIDLIRKNMGKTPANPSDPTNDGGKETLTEAIDAYLESHLYGQLQLAELCRHFNKSSSGLCRLYKSVTGTSIIDHYLELKITKAKRMLLDGEWNITQISEQLGFGSIYYFTRVFKNRTGMAPSTYIKTIRDWQTAHHRNLEE